MCVMQQEYPIHVHSKSIIKVYNLGVETQLAQMHASAIMAYGKEAIPIHNGGQRSHGLQRSGIN